MSKRLLFCGVALMLAASFTATAKDGAWTGWITDSHCGARGASEKHADCAAAACEQQADGHPQQADARQQAQARLADEKGSVPHSCPQTQEDANYQQSAMGMAVVARDAAIACASSSCPQVDCVEAAGVRAGTVDFNLRRPGTGGAISLATAALPAFTRLAAGDDPLSLQRLLFYGLGLAAPHVGVDAVLHHQRHVRAALGDAALDQHDDLVGVDHGRQAMGDDDGRAAARYLA